MTIIVFLLFDLGNGSIILILIFHNGSWGIDNRWSLSKSKTLIRAGAGVGAVAVVPQPNTRSNIEVTKPQTFNGAVNKV